jgi:Cu-Zn family superoxide dismutase
MGDLGNIAADAKGNALITFYDSIISLYGEYSIIGKSVVVH